WTEAPLLSQDVSRPRRRSSGIRATANAARHRTGAEDHQTDGPMNMLSSWLTRLYALAIFAFPASHRAVFRAEMLDTFRQALSRHRGWAGVRFGVAAALNAIAAGVGERRRERQRHVRSTTGRGISLTGLGSDLLLAARALRQAKAFTAVSVVSLGVGMGLVMAIVILLRILTGAPPGIETARVVEVLIAPQGDLRARAGE